MENFPEPQFTHSQTVSEDGTVAFGCSTDVEKWPWLALPIYDPIFVQSINFYASVEAGLARGTFDPTKWTALTQMEWACERPESGAPVRGVATTNMRDELPYFELSFFDASDALVLNLLGKGVVFRTRDFENWREIAKQKMDSALDVAEFQFAPSREVGVRTQGESYISSLIQDDRVSAQALITETSGFRPAHPYHSGSGDHVNANHLADVGRQFACLVLGDAGVRCCQGEMSFTSYVELGRPFDITLEEDARAQSKLSIAFHQAGRACARMAVQYEAGS